MSAVNNAEASQRVPPMWALRRARKERGMSQVELSKASGVAQRTISEIETGRRSPHVATLRRLAEALEVEVDGVTRVPVSPSEDVSGLALTASDDEFEKLVKSARLDTILGSLVPSLNEAVKAARLLGDEEASRFATRRHQRAAREWMERAGYLWERPGGGIRQSKPGGDLGDSAPDPREPTTGEGTTDRETA